MKLLPYGERALLVEVAGNRQALALAADLGTRLAGAADLVPGYRSVLVLAASADALDGLRAHVLRAARAVEATGGSADVPRGGAPVELPVRYDGPDLAPLAAEVRLSADELVARHAAGRYTVAFCGFAPGFAYLTGLDRRLRAPRLREPRTAVPAGSVGIAGEFTGVYPRPSPGGWRLLGTTDAPLWDSARPQPALLPPGTAVRFVPT